MKTQPKRRKQKATMRLPPPLPPPLPPLLCGNPPSSVNPPPRPQHAAVPIPLDERYPIPETGGPPQHHHIQDGAAQPEEQEDEEKSHPVQETNPAPQTNANPQLSEVADVESDGALNQADEAEDD